MTSGKLVPALEARQVLRIAQVAPLYESVPPKLYGGTERIVAHLTNALVDLGHEVTLFATRDADTRATLVPVRDEPIRLDASQLKSDLASHLSMLHEVHCRRSEFDVIHFHTDMLHFPLFEHCAARTVTTLHGRLDIKDLAHVYTRWPGFPLVSISDSQRLPLASANWVKTIHHGVAPFATSPASIDPDAEPYLLFIGRISPEKRPDRAIAVAKACEIKLKIAAKVDAADRSYFKRDIEPLLDDPLIDFIGEVGEAEKPALLGGAKALLFPIDWPEPFGLVMIEAMSYGTPIIAWRCGSVPEVMEDGVTGFIVENEPQAIAAVGRLDTIDRAAVQPVFPRRFAANVMATSYVALYEALIHADTLRLPAVPLFQGEAQ